MRIITLALLLLPALAWAQTPPAPLDCEHSPEHRQFDFWLGKWQVQDGKGREQGHNEIAAVQNQCALREQWRSVSGGGGESLNYYNPVTERWRQLWVDAGYSIIDIEGGLDGEDMVLEGSITYLTSGAVHPFRARWSPLEDGRVRQFFEQGDAEGNWQVWFEGFYSRVTD